MIYRLIVLTHGRSETLSETLATFHELVTPAPLYKTVFHDDGSLGFCRSCREAWTEAAKDLRVQHVFWLEHDFRFLRPVDLTELASVLDEQPQVAQMALMRDSIDDAERKAGGVYRFHKWDGVEHSHRYRWLEHSSNLTTNPSLMRRQFMADNPWPIYRSGCEGKFSANLRRRGYMFGTWDLGEVYVEHTGALRTGHSY